MTYESRVLTGRTVSVEAKRNLVERSRPRPRVPRATEGAVEVSPHITTPRATEGAVEYTTHSPRNGENGDRGGRHLFLVGDFDETYDAGLLARAID